MEYIRAQTKPKDGKLLAIGHSMGGILLYAMLSRCSKIPSLTACHVTVNSSACKGHSMHVSVLLGLVDLLFQHIKIFFIVAHASPIICWTLGLVIFPSQLSL